jgi:hypothetical protein
VQSNVAATVNLFEEELKESIFFEAPYIPIQNARNVSIKEPIKIKLPKRFVSIFNT